MKNKATTVVAVASLLFPWVMLHGSCATVSKSPQPDGSAGTPGTTAYAYLILDDQDKAHHYLKFVVKGYPFTQAGEKADQKLKAFQ